MTLIVNGQPLEIEPRMTVADLLARLNMGHAPCAVEVNTILIPKAAHASKSLAEGDKVEVVTLVGGG